MSFEAKCSLTLNGRKDVEKAIQIDLRDAGLYWHLSALASEDHRQGLDVCH